METNKELSSKRKIIIYADYDTIYMEKDCDYGFEPNGSLNFYDEASENVIFSIYIEGFFSWSDEIKDCIIASACDKEYNFNFDSWNKRGLEFAKKLREQLPDEFELYYSFVFEDEKNRGKEAMLIEK